MPDFLPNSIPKNPKIDWNLSRGDMRWLYIFCANCGADGGRVLETNIPNREEFAFYLCNSCAEKHGEIAGTIMIPDDVFFQRVAEAQLETNGHYLTEEEMAVELQNESSIFSKLAKEKL